MLALKTCMICRNLNKVTVGMTSCIWLSSPLKTYPTEDVTLSPTAPSFTVISVLISDWLQAEPVRHIQVMDSVWCCSLLCWQVENDLEERDSRGFVPYMPFPFGFKRHFFWSEPTDAFLNFRGFGVLSHCYKVVMQIISSARSSS